MDAAHRNGDRQDNRPENLRWATRAENEYDKRALGRANIGDRNGQAKLTEDAVVRIRRLASSLPRSSGGARYRKGCMIPIAREYGVTVSAVQQILSGRRWSHV
jgi:hypothetical protein